jgi:predicted amidophosphoribosyltransferase
VIRHRLAHLSLLSASHPCAGGTEACPVLAWALSLLAPPLCCTCGSPAPAGHPLCPACAEALRLAPAQPLLIPGADRAIAAAPYDGVARRLVAALKFRGLLAAAGPMAAAIANAVELDEDAAIVPVPPAPRRRRSRGFDPAGEIAKALGELTGRPLLRCLRRGDGVRQVGRPRRERIASPPCVWTGGAAPANAVLVDDVVTTGATLTSCAMALYGAGALAVRAVAFARSQAGPRPERATKSHLARAPNRA